eukprot:gene18971-20878_t
MDATTELGILYSVFLILLMVIALFGNLIVIVSVALTASLRAQVASRLIISLATSDMMGALGLPVRISMALAGGSFCFNLAFCKFAMFYNSFADIASITNIFFISIDRFLSISRPLSYASLMTARKVNIMICFIWLYAMTWPMFSLFSWQRPEQSTVQLVKSEGRNRCINTNNYYYILVLSVVFICPLIIIGVMYLKMLKEAAKHNRVIQHATQMQSQSNKSRKRSEVIANLKSARAIGIVYGAFMMCWLPNCTMTIHSMLHPIWWMQFRQQNSTSFYAIYYLLAEVLPTLHICLNPFIYSIFHSSFRKAVKRTLCRIAGK